MHRRQARPERHVRAVTGGPGAPLIARRAGGALLAALLVAAVLVLGAGPASAHVELEASSPQHGAVLKAAPAALTFTFSAELLDTGNAITLTPLKAEMLPLGKPTVDGPTLSVPWPKSAPAGVFTAAYRVVSGDGHPVEGTITFTVETPTGAASSTSSDPSPVLVGTVPTGLPSAVASEPSPSPSPVSAAADSAPLAGGLAWILSFGVIALVAALAAGWAIRRNKP